MEWVAPFEHEPSHFLDEQRHAPGANGDALDRVSGKRIVLGDGADHLPHLAEIERNQRDNAVMRPRRPGRAKFGARRRDDH